MSLLKVNKVFCFVTPGIFLLFSFFANAQNTRVTATTDKKNIIIGEPLQFNVEAVFPVNTYKVTWLDFPDSIAHFELVEKQKPDSTETNGMLKVQQRIIITSFDSGLRTIPSFNLNFDPFSGDTAFSMLTDSVRVNVSFAPMDSSTTFHDIKTIIPLKDEWPLWVWIVAAVSVVLIIVLVYYLYKKYKKKTPATLFTSKLSPLEEALQSLKELEKQGLPGQQQVKLFHSTLGEIFKRYMSRRLNATFLNLTTMEVLLRLNELPIKKELIGIVANNLRMGDAVKFAKYVPGRIESEEAFSNTKRVIGQIDQTFQNSKSDI